MPTDQGQQIDRGQRTKVLFAVASDNLPGYPSKDGRATDSCFTLIWAHQHGVLMVDAG